MITDKEKNMAVLSYFSVLALIPIFKARDSKFTRFHANQGLVLLIAEAVCAVLYYVCQMIVYAVSWRLGFLTTAVGFIGVLLVAFSILGMVNAVTGIERKIPILGDITVLKNKE